jgi:hypothetical protein
LRALWTVVFRPEFPPKPWQEEFKTQCLKNTKTPWLENQTGLGAAIFCSAFATSLTNAGPL